MKAQDTIYRLLEEKILNAEMKPSALTLHVSELGYANTTIRVIARRFLKEHDLDKSYRCLEYSDRVVLQGMLGLKAHTNPTGHRRSLTLPDAEHEDLIGAAVSLLERGIVDEVRCHPSIVSTVESQKVMTFHNDILGLAIITRF